MEVQCQCICIEPRRTATQSSGPQTREPIRRSKGRFTLTNGRTSGGEQCLQLELELRARRHAVTLRRRAPPDIVSSMLHEGRFTLRVPTHNLYFQTAARRDAALVVAALERFVREGAPVARLARPPPPAAPTHMRIGAESRALPAAFPRTLETLEVVALPLARLDAQMFALASLTRLSISRAALGAAANLGRLALLRRLRNLRALDLSHNGIAGLPFEVWAGLPRSLVQLDLSGNALASLPVCVMRLLNLEELRLAGNAMQFVPDCVGLLAKLRVLDLDDCGIKSFPLYLVTRALKLLRLSGNPWFEPPDLDAAARELRSPPELQMTAACAVLNNEKGDLAEMELLPNSLQGRIQSECRVCLFCYSFKPPGTQLNYKLRLNTRLAECVYATTRREVPLEYVSCTCSGYQTV